MEYKVYCWAPYYGSSRKIAEFRDKEDAYVFAANKAETYARRWYQNKGTYVSDECGKIIREFSIEHTNINNERKHPNHQW